jgi:uncharacterized protein YjdB
MKKNTSERRPASKAAALVLLLLGGVFLLAGCSSPTNSDNPTTYAVTASPADHGTIDASPNPAAEGATVTVTAAPATVYEPNTNFKWNDGVADYPLTLVKNGAIYTASFTMPAGAVTVSGTFKAKPENGHSVIIPSSITNGTITVTSPTGTSYPETGVTVELSIAPNPGYKLQAGSLTVNAGAVTVNVVGNTASFTMPNGDATIAATFVQIPTYDITVPPSGISASPNPAIEGATVTLTITPPNGKILDTSSLTWNDGGADYPLTPTVSGSGYTASFTMPAHAVTVSATFDDIPVDNYLISTSGLHGTFYINTNSGGNYAEAGETVDVYVEADGGYLFKSLTINGGDVSFNYYYQYDDYAYGYFEMPAGTATVTAVFEAIPTYAITTAVSPSGAGTVSASPNPAREWDLVTVTATANANYTLISLDYTDSTGDHHIYGNSFEMPASLVTVTATFKVTEGPSYSITSSATMAHGTVIASPASAPAGSLVNLAITADPGYTLNPDYDYEFYWESNPYSGPWGYIYAAPGSDLRHFTAAFSIPNNGTDVTIYAEFVPLVKSISISPATVELAVGAYYQLTATVSPANAYNKDVYWTSSNPAAVEVVDQDYRVIHAIIPGGSATITATAQDGSEVFGTALVTVKEGAGITVNFTGFGDETFYFEQTDGQVLSKSDGYSMYVYLHDVPGGPSATYLDGKLASVSWYSWYNNNYYTYFDPSDLPLGPHTLSIEVFEYGTPYSKVVSFEVVE